jgi:Family of unknown function (DUF6551)
MVMPLETRKATLTKADGTKVAVPVRRISVSDISIDSEYQRDLDNVWVQKMVRDGWQEALAGVVILSSRAGRLLAVDGQHRVALARECGVRQVWAYIIEGLSQAQEADLFGQFQRKRRSLRVWETFKADTTAQKKDALDIARTVHQVGFRIDRSATAGTITAIGALISIHKLGGVDLLRDTLTVIKRLWTLDDAMALRGQIMHGIAIFLYSFEHEPQFRMERLEKVLPETAPAKLLRLAQAIASRRSSASVGAANVGEALRDLYNKGISPDRQLGALRSGSGKRRPSATTSR